MQILAISDVHDRFEKVLARNLPDADVCLVAGDMTNYGIRGTWRLSSAQQREAFGDDLAAASAWQGNELARARQWLTELGQRYPTYWIPGNHDIGVKPDTFGAIENVTCILDTTVTFSGLTIHGVSLSPCYTFPELAQQWDYMTADETKERAAYAFEPVDIVVSHSPPYGALDSGGWVIGRGKESYGSPALAEYIARYSPRLVICGHVHEGQGQARLGTTDIYNVAETAQIIELDTSS